MMNGQVRRVLEPDVTEVRHFRGTDDEIAREKRLIPYAVRKLHGVKKLRDYKDLLAKIKSSTTVTVVYGVEKIRLFNIDNQETFRFSFEDQIYTTRENQRRVIDRNHAIRTEVLKALTDPTDGNSSVETVSLIPGDVEHYDLTQDALSKKWQKELDKFCAALPKRYHNSRLRHVHFDSNLCMNLNIDHLLQSSLEEISLPDLEEKWWRDFAARLARDQTLRAVTRNQRLRVVTVQYNMKNTKAFLQTLSNTRQEEPISESWTTLCISLPNEFMTGAHAMPEEEAEAMASTLDLASSVSTFVIEYSPPEQPPELRAFAKYLRRAVRAPNVSVLHLLVPFRSPELHEHILSMKDLTCLILVLDFWGKNDLKAVKNMIRDSPRLEVFGLRRQDAKRKLSFTKRRLLFHGITKTDIVEFLEHDRSDETSLQTLSLRGWDLVEGDKISEALDIRRRAQPNLYIDLTGTGLLLKNKRAAHVAPVVSSERWISTPWRLSSSRNSSQAGRNGSVYQTAVSRWSASASSSQGVSGSFVYDEKIPIEELDELNSSNHRGPGSVCAETRDHQLSPQQQQQNQQLQQQHSGRLQGPPMHFSTFSFDQLQKATRNFNPSDVIGRGGFGQVYYGELVTPDHGRRAVAVKDLNLEGVNWERLVKSFETELQTLGHLHHVNLVRLLGYCTHDRRRLLVYEFMPELSLDHWIFRDDPQEDKLQWKTRVSIAVGVARGLTYLHTECNPPIIHMDIKPQNILLDRKMAPKLADFGIAKLVVDTEQNLATLTRAIGTECYMAPEIYQSDCVTPQSDVFSFGLLLLEILRGKKNKDMPRVDEDSHLAFPFWARKKFQTGQYKKVYEQLTAPLASLLIPGYEEEKAQKMLCIAIACISDDMVYRPDMRTVMLMLEDREPVPDPSQCRPYVRYDVGFYDSIVR